MSPLFSSRILNAKIFNLIFYCFAFIFFISTLNAQPYAQQTILNATDATAADRFGSSVSMDGFWALVGAPGEGGENEIHSHGSSYFYQYGINGWLEFQKITSSTDLPQYQYFGTSVALSKNTAIIGAPGIFGEVGNVSGKAFVFEFDGESWNEEQVFTADADSLLFGEAVDIDGDFMAVGAPATFTADSGSVYIYQNDGNNWVLRDRLRASDASAGDGFGIDVSISGNKIIVGSNNRGAYIFRYDGISDSWIEEQHIRYINENTFTLSGTSVAIHKSRILVGTFDNDGRDHVAVFSFSDSTWLQETELMGWGLDGFGHSLALNDNILVVGAYLGGHDFPQGVVIAYRYNDGFWDGVENWLNEGEADQYYGYSVDVHNSTIISGAPRKSSWTGAAYIHELTYRPYITNISNGTYSNRNKISWSLGDVPTPLGFKIYREQELIDSTSVSTMAYYDYDAIPGKLQHYGVSSIGSYWGESLPDYSLGWQQANGKLEGRVKTPYGAGVDSVEINIESSGSSIFSCLEFDGENDVVQVDHDNSLNIISDEFTIEAWIKNTNTPGSNWKRIITKRGDSHYWYSLCLLNDKLTLELGNTEVAYETFSINEKIQGDDKWHHIAAKRNSSNEISLFLDGREYYAGVFTYDFNNTEILEIGKWENEAYDGESFKGKIDEVRIWNVERTEEEILANMNRSLKGDETGLVAYWTFDDLPTRTPEGIVGEYSKNSGLHGKLFGAEYSPVSNSAFGTILTDENGNYDVANIYYGNSSLLDLTPNKLGHAFDPGIKTIEMNQTRYELESVDFIDTTSLTIAGTILMDGTRCTVPGVEIILDDAPTGIITDLAGKFSLSVDRPGYYNLKFDYSDSASAHAFNPNSLGLDLQDDKLGLTIIDTTKHKLSGMLRGACDGHIGRAEILVTTMGDAAGCFQDTIITDSNGNFSVILPAQIYMLDVINVYPDDPELPAQRVLQYFSADTINLKWHDQRHDFIYRETPRIVINNWPDFGEGDYNVPILEQDFTYDLEILIEDVWGDESCPVNQGSITIYDDLSGNSDPVTIDLVDGVATYQFIPGEPNIFATVGHPYQKLFEVVANIGEETTSLQQWALITGHHPRSQTFTATTPEMPFLILRDPPGDKSFSFLEKDETIAWSTVHSYQPSFAAGAWWDVRVGAIADVSVGIGVVSIGSSAGAYVIASGSVLVGTEHNIKTGKLHQMTFAEKFSTADNDNFIGESGDVFVGASYVNLYALTDVIGYDWTSHEVVIDTTLAWEPKAIESTFTYTESHIRNTLLPQLRELKFVARSEESDSLVVKYENSINTWESILARNDSLKNISVFEKNISFSAGAPYSSTHTIENASYYSYDYSIFVEAELALGIGIVDRGVPAEGGVIIKAGFRYQRVDESTTTTKITTGYTLDDDDAGDFFSVNLKNDTQFGTPVFDVVGGTSSNPWEKGSQPRDGVDISMNKYEAYNIQPEDPAPFILYLGNKSESGEEREYHVSVIQSSNLDGAIIRIGGVVIEDHLSYTIPAGEQLTATLSVDRGPIAYDYENLKVKMYAPGDEQAIADTVTFSVHYISPCSDVNLLIPENNWVLNSSDNDTLQFVINEYDTDNQHLKSVKFQYRRRGEGWNTPFIYAKDNIASEFIMKDWNISFLMDGEYELRAVSDCGQQGVKYSAIAEGVIDRSALIVFGTPEPSDGVLNLGEDITFAFSGEIDPAFLNENSASLFVTEDSTEIEIVTAVFENTLIITPQEDLALFEDKLLTATVSGIRDKNGNRLRKKVSHIFRVNQSPVYWSVPNVVYTIYQDADESFTRTLKNAGGLDESFTIMSHPQWLTPSIMNGSIPPSGEQEITFNVNSQLNVASYRDTVVVVTSSGEERLLVTLNVLHEAPLWQVNPAIYSFSMNLTAQVVFDDTLSRDVFDKVGVYNGDELRGVAQIEHVAAIDKYVAFITVYSNQASGEILTFRLWDASKGREYAFFGSDYTFTSNSTLGTVSAPLIIEPDAHVQVIDLNAGWTWFGLNVYAGSVPLDFALSSLNPSEGDLIKSQNRFSQYSKELGWRGGLRSLEIGSCYQIYLKGGGSFQYTGAPIDPVQATMNIEKGWNWIAHMNPKILDLNETLNLFPAAAGDRIKSQTEFADFIAATQTWEGSLKKMVPGQGYLFKSNTETQFQYPVLGKVSFSYPAIPEWEIDINAYEYNMSMTSVIEFDDKEMQDSTLILAAFSDYECRGLTQIQYIPEMDKYIGFLPVYSNKVTGDSINFEVFEPSSGKRRPVTEKTMFTTDNLVGNLDEPFVLSAEPIGDELVPYKFYLRQNYPNPFNPETIIEYGLSQDSDVEITVYNTLGQKVATLVNEFQQAHHYKITFNASDYFLATGVYLYQIKSGNFVKRRKLLFIK
ncbi:MAG: T9SS C-terminal target domain-containing protein [Calditrichaeota bacterium]|nr:MAG: T9SS C-terminal target domain-containing protein [Calditrichota bacterium]MBL1206881.1 T9SS C-terminal target domain-containing protein [Calditrichota bacterium]NOG46708.1 T9SS type A sorting domain-containing protein [Calditrichota bacterium]